VNELTAHPGSLNPNYIETSPVSIEPTYHDPVTIEPDFTEIVPAEEIVHEHHLPENLSLEQHEIEMIKRALEKHNGKRKDAAKELGISERTLYRKINEFGIKQ
jgi:transcriptional regulator with PAS, ATPase and Fis domain